MDTGQATVKLGNVNIPKCNLSHYLEFNRLIGREINRKHHQFNERTIRVKLLENYTKWENREESRGGEPK